MERVAITEGERTRYRPQTRLCQVLARPASLAIPALLSHPYTATRQHSTLQAARHGTRSLTGPRIHDTCRAARGAAERAGSRSARSWPQATATFELGIRCDAVVPVDGGTQVEGTTLQHTLGIVGQPALERSATEAPERPQRVTAALAAQQEG